MRLFSIILFFSCLSLYSCRDKNSTPVIRVNPSDINITANAGDVINFEIFVDGGKDELSKFLIYQEPDKSAKTKILDTLVNGEKLYYTFSYTVPDSISGSIIITFSACDADGDKSDVALRIVIPTPNPVILTETTGHIIYSKYSGKPDAFDVNTNSVQFSGIAQQNLLDIADFDTIPSDSVLSKTWYSPAGNEFVFFNGFDYANATNISAKAAYDSGNKLSLISNLNINDIIITKVNNGTGQIYAVIKITNIIEAASSVNDRYEFNVKK
ncbi:MAG: hypothetical protein WC223_08135 [Bacteroidales bacterium]|jgi:hypothetical protein